MLSFLLFADGASAALVTAEQTGLALGRFQAAVIPRSQDLITWHIGDSGFRDASVRPGSRPYPPLAAGARTGAAAGQTRRRCGRSMPAGGRSSTRSSKGLHLAPDALRYSRDVLRDYGNMSSATLMFVLDRILRDPDASGFGMAMAFGPGLIGRNLRLPSAMNLSRRSDRQERMDTDCVDYGDYSRCLRDLSRVNAVTLTHRPMLAWLGKHAHAGDFSVLDIACGHGDALRKIRTRFPRLG